MKRDLCIAPRVLVPEDVSARAAELERAFEGAGVTVAILASWPRSRPCGFVKAKISRD